MTLKNSSVTGVTPQVSCKVLVNEKLKNDKNLLKLKYLLKYLGIKKKFFIIKIRHNKIFSVLIKNKMVIRKNSKQILNPKFNSLSAASINKLNLYKNFISFIFKAGKKHIWEKIIANIFLLIHKNLKISQNIILLKVFLRLYSKVEIKKIKTRKKTALVPVFVSMRRRFFLALKWLLFAVNTNKLQISLKEKLFLEIFKLIANKSCESVKQLEKNNETAYLNRANFHYRW